MLRAAPGLSRKLFRSPVNRLGSIPPIFSLPFADLGAGAVNTAPAFAIGSSTPTFARATVAWTKLASGLWAQVASGVARSCYLGANTAVGAYGGYFAEDAGVQLVTPTASIRDMTDGAWMAVNVTPAKTATGIDGVVNSASTLTCTVNGGTILQTLTAAATSRTFSAWVRRKTGTGSVFIQQNASTLDITALINSSTYTRVSLTATILNAAFGFIIGVSGDAIEVDFNQFEAQAFATSPMASAGAARNLDTLTYLPTGNVNPTTGSAYAEVTVPWATCPNNAPFISFNDSTISPLLNLSGASTEITINDGAVNLTKTALTNMQTGVRKRASSWGGTTLLITGDGVAPQSGVFDGTMANSSLSINGISTRATWGMMQNVRLYGVALTAAQLQSMTA